METQKNVSERCIMNNKNEYFAIQVRFHKTKHAELWDWLKQKTLDEDAKMPFIVRHLIRAAIKQEQEQKEPQEPK